MAVKYHRKVQDLASIWMFVRWVTQQMILAEGNVGMLLGSGESQHVAVHLGRVRTVHFTNLWPLTPKSPLAER